MSFDKQHVMGAEEAGIALHNSTLFEVMQVLERAGLTLSARLNETPAIAGSVVNLLEALQVRVAEIKPDPEILAALEASSRQEERLSGMREALERIANWEMPETGDFYDIAQTRPVSYGAAWGSNGERDVIIGYARAALEPPHAKDQG